MATRIDEEILREWIDGRDPLVTVTRAAAQSLAEEILHLRRVQEDMNKLKKLAYESEG